MAEIARVRAEHRLVDVLARAGIELPDANSRSVMVSCPLPDHDDATPSMVVHLDTDRYHCFGCGAHGDALQLVLDLEGITSLSRAAEVLDSRRALRSFPSLRSRASFRTGAAHSSTGVASTAAVAVNAVEQPDLCRTGPERVLEVNTTAWTFLTEASRATRARRYLSCRGIDLRALEDETGRPLAGHSPASRTGLSEHLLSVGFTRAELIDTGWVSASPDRPLLDRYRGRVLLPARDGDDRVIGVYARDATGHAKAKYLNTPDTVVYHKGGVLYRPVNGTITGDTTVVVCEGSLDALAIAATAAAAGRSSSFAPVAASGTALTAHQVQALLHLSDRPPVLCADGDEPGLRAMANWAAAILRERRECLTTELPDGADPAEWLAEHGADGLAAFCRPVTGHDTSSVCPHPPGALVATAICTGLRGAGYRDDTIATFAVRKLGELGRGLVRPGDRQRFALDAARALATEGLGVASALGSEVSDAIVARNRSGARTDGSAVPRREILL